MYRRFTMKNEVEAVASNDPAAAAGANQSREETSEEKVNENLVMINVLAEKYKIDFSETIAEEFTEKVILFGYLIVCIKSNVILFSVYSSPINLKSSIYY